MDVQHHIYQEDQEPLADYMKRVLQYASKVKTNGDELTKKISELNNLASYVSSYSTKVQNEKNRLQQEWDDEKKKQLDLLEERQNLNEKMKKLKVLSDETETKTTKAVQQANEHIEKVQRDEISIVENLLQDNLNSI